MSDLLKFNVFHRYPQVFHIRFRISTKGCEFLKPLYFLDFMI